MQNSTTSTENGPLTKPKSITQADPEAKQEDSLVKTKSTGAAISTQLKAITKNLLEEFEKDTTLEPNQRLGAYEKTSTNIRVARNTSDKPFTKQSSNTLPTLEEDRETQPYVGRQERRGGEQKIRKHAPILGTSPVTRNRDKGQMGIFV